MSSVIAENPFLTIRNMKEMDLDEVMKIERSVYKFPWSRQIFVDCLRVGYHCRVGIMDGQIVGYAISSSGAGEAHILNLCVGAAYRRLGLGRLMLSSLISFFKKHRLSTIFLEVRESNDIAIKLYDSLGFNEIGRRCDYYPAPGGREDALIFALNLSAD